MLKSAKEAALAGDESVAAEHLAAAAALAIRLDSLSLCNQVARQGCLSGFAAVVRPAAEHAVAGLPDNGAYRDTRGLVRAIIGDRAGAADDFLAYAAWTKSEGRFAYEYNGAALREKWAAELRDGRDPLDAASLESLSTK
jgi:hypothetical protein